MRRARTTLFLVLASVPVAVASGIAVPATAAAPPAAPTVGSLVAAALEERPSTPAAASGAPPAATTDARPDPAGDVVDRNGQTIEPRADITGIDFTYGADRLDVTVAVPGGVDPATSPNWRGNISGLVVVFDVNGDEQPDFAGALFADEKGALHGGVLRLPPEPAPDALGQFHVCEAAASFGGGSYRLDIPSSCIGNAYEVRGGALLLFNRATRLSEDLDLTFDTAAHGRDLLGVHRDTAKNGTGYRFVASDGGIFSFGTSAFFGSTGDRRLNQPVVGMESTRTANGYWLVASDGGIFTFGDAGYFGSTGDLVLDQPITAVAATPTGNGYWLVARDGGIFTFGDAGFFGATPAGLTAPVVGMASTPAGDGYWLAAADGTVHAYGAASDHGSSTAPTGTSLAGIAASPSGNGYWLAFSDGSITSRGDTRFFGDTGFMDLTAPVVGLEATPTGRGYWLLGRDGGVFTFGDAGFFGSTGAMKLNQPVLGLAL